MVLFINSARVKKSAKVSFSTGRVSVIEIKKPQSDPRESPIKPSLGKDEGRTTTCIIAKAMSEITLSQADQV
jgi:hypothetical protein